MMTAMNSSVAGFDRHAILRWLAGPLAAAAATLLLVAFKASSAVAGMIFLMLVVGAATVAPQWLSLSIAIACALSFDYFFLPPFRTLWISGTQEWVAMFTFVVSCVVVNRVAERARRQAIHAEQRREDVERLYELSQEMMLHDDAAGLIRDLPRLIASVFALEGAAVYVSDHDQFYASGSDLPMSAEANLRAVLYGSAPPF